MIAHPLTPPLAHACCVPSEPRPALAGWLPMLLPACLWITAPAPCQSGTPLAWCKRLLTLCGAALCQCALTCMLRRSIVVVSACSHVSERSLGLLQCSNMVRCHMLVSTHWGCCGAARRQCGRLLTCCGAASRGRLFDSASPLSGPVGGRRGGPDHARRSLYFSLPILFFAKA